MAIASAGLAAVVGSTAGSAGGPREGGPARLFPLPVLLGRRVCKTPTRPVDRRRRVLMPGPLCQSAPRQPRHAPATAPGRLRSTGPARTAPGRLRSVLCRAGPALDRAVDGPALRGSCQGRQMRASPAQPAAGAAAAAFEASLCDALGIENGSFGTGRPLHRRLRRPGGWQPGVRFGDT